MARTGRMTRTARKFQSRNVLKHAKLRRSYYLVTSTFERGSDICVTEASRSAPELTWSKILMVSLCHHNGKTNSTEDVSSTDWELLTNLKPRSVLKSNSSSLFLEVSYPHPWREFKLLKREEVYNFDVMKFKRRYLKGKNNIVSILRRIISMLEGHTCPWAVIKSN
jgi:hypothetical protein